MKRILNITAIFIFIFLAIITGCEPDYSDLDCSECYRIKPEWGALNVDVTINNENDSVPVIIYRGKPEDNDIEWVDTAVSKDYIIDVPIATKGRYYSIAAYYKVGENTVIAVDGDEIKSVKTTTACDTTCWYISGGSIDVRLKYTEIDE
ncbi:MAG: hypothetical protein KJ607_11420 [Bacteroidetes bacterium]|nr:hypothetical protein [Bacteroidota bacterium]